MPLPENHPLSEYVVFAHTASVGTTPVRADTVAPFRGKIVKLGAILAGTITTAVASCATAINGTGISNGTVTIPIGAAGTRAESVPTANCDVNDGDGISFTPSGATGSNIPATFYAVIRRY